MVGQKAFRILTYNLPGANIFMVSLDCETTAEMKDTESLVLSVLILQDQWQPMRKDQLAMRIENQ